MKTLFISYQCKKGERGNFLDAITSEKLDVASRNEEGNIQYTYFLPKNDEETLLLLEGWKDQESIDSLSNSIHYKRIGELKAKYVEKTNIYRSDNMVTTAEFENRNNCSAL